MISEVTTRLVSDSWMGARNSFLHHHIQNLVVLIYLLIIKLVSCIAMYPGSPRFKSYYPDTGHRTVRLSLLKRITTASLTSTAKNIIH
jgi:hypothetical protein